MKKRSTHHMPHQLINVNNEMTLEHVEKITKTKIPSKMFGFKGASSFKKDQTMTVSIPIINISSNK